MMQWGPKVAALAGNDLQRLSGTPIKNRGQWESVSYDQKQQDYGNGNRHQSDVPTSIGSPLRDGLNGLNWAVLVKGSHG